MMKKDKDKEKEEDLFSSIVMIGLLILIASLFQTNVIKEGTRFPSQGHRIFVQSDEKQEGLPGLIKYILDHTKK
ncbi:hypothetical protein QM418_09935 [Streptococcus infantis]|jgi:hypothetical protein|uniref:hypothetical protein n=1 Tax=Streptococcus infantis TaxID=68892 RepID=UPI0039C0C611